MVSKDCLLVCLSLVEGFGAQTTIYTLLLPLFGHSTLRSTWHLTRNPSPKKQTTNTNRPFQRNMPNGLTNLRLGNKFGLNLV